MPRIFKIALLSLLLLWSSFSFSQTNLVPNPSFEDTVNCPSGPGQVYNSNGWSGYNYSPDYFNSCATSTNFLVPNNWAGYQQPASGNAYCGFITYTTRVTSSNAREFIGGMLSSPLAIGTKYYVSFQVSLSLDSLLQTNCASDKIGATFSTIPLTISNPGLITNNPQIYTNSIITDTLNWTTIFGSFISDSTYQYIILGNFFDDNNTDTLIMNADTLCNASYYYIDNVCLSTDSVYALNWTGISNHNFFNSILVYPNPSKDYINIDLPSLKKSYEIRIYDMLGREVLLKQNISTRHTFVDISNIASGMFLIKISYDNQSFYYKQLKK